jgi:hypothetical protein
MGGRSAIRSTMMGIASSGKKRPAAGITRGHEGMRSGVHREEVKLT